MLTPFSSRAKEKNKASKKSQGTASAAATNSTTGSGADSATTNTDSSSKEEDDPDVASPPPPTPGEELPEELTKSDSPQDIPPNQQADPQVESPSPALASPPKLHVLTDPTLRPSSASSWKPTQVVETPPDSAVFPSRLSLADIHSQRRGSLPANAFFHPYSTTPTHPPRSIDAWDPPARRRSVDTSLQRLVTHPYAQLARARNGALFGPRSPSLPQPSRQHSLPNRKPLSLQSQRRMLPHHPPPNDYLDMRRASMDPRTLMPNRADGLSPSPSPHSFHPVRASLPDTSLFGTSRRYVPQIPGPLPAPNFTFGAATVSSPCSADDDPPSPDLSSYSFPPKDDVAEDDDVISSFSFESLSRFGSAVSIATSESSVLSNPGFYDIGSAPGELAPDQERRSSWYVNVSLLAWHFVFIFSFHDSGSTHHAQSANVATGLNGAIPPLQSSAPVTTESSTRTVRVPGVNNDPQRKTDDVSPLLTFSPASTAPLDNGSATGSSTPPANVSASHTSELVSPFSAISGKPGLPSGSSLSPQNPELLEQQEQQSLAHIPSLTQIPPSNQQQLMARHQMRAVGGDVSSIFDESTESRIGIAATAPGDSQSMTPVVLTDHKVAGAQSMDKQLKAPPTHDETSLATTRDLAKAQGGYAAQYHDLMGGYCLGVPLAMLDTEPTMHAIGQHAQRQSTVVGCDPMASLAANIDFDGFTANGIATSAPYSAGPSVSGIGVNQPGFEVSFGS